MKNLNQRKEKENENSSQMQDQAQKYTPQLIAIKEVKLTTEVKVKNLSYKSNSAEKSAQIKKKEIKRKIEKNKENDKHKYKSIFTFNEIFAKQKVNKILEVASHPEESKKIPHEDFDTALTYCIYDEKPIGKLYEIFIEPVVKLRKKFIRAFGYYAENKNFLNTKVMNYLLKALPYEQYKVKKEILYALSYAIHNGQNFESDTILKIIKETIDVTLNKYEKGDYKLFPLLIISISALTKLGVRIEDNYIDILKMPFIMLYGEEKKPMFHIKQKCNNPDDFDRTSKLSTTNEKINKFKQIAKSNNKLSINELTYLVHTWLRIQDKELKRKIIRTLMYVIKNGQTILVEEKNSISMLVRSLISSDRNTRVYALIALGALCLNEEKYEKYKTEITRALAKIKTYAINGFFYYFHKYGKNNLDVASWKKLLEKVVREDTNEEIKRTAKFTLMYLNENTEILEELLLQKEFYKDSLSHLQEYAKKKLPFTRKSIENLSYIIVNEYPIEDKDTVIEIFNAAAENNQFFSKEVIVNIIEFCKKSLENNLFDSVDRILILIGVIAISNPLNFEYARKSITEIVLKTLKNNNLAQNSCFLFINWLLQEKEITSLESLAEIVKSLIEILSNCNLEIEVRDNAALALVITAKKGYGFNKEVLARLAKNHFVSSETIDLRLKIIEIFRWTISFNHNITIIPKTIDRILSLLGNSNESLVEECACLTVDIFNNTNTVLTQENLNTIIKLLDVNSIIYPTIYRLLKQIKFKEGVNYTESVVKKLMKNIEKNQSAVLGDMLSLFVKLTKHIKLNDEKFVKFILKLLGKNESKINRKAIKILNNILCLNPANAKIVNANDINHIFHYLLNNNEYQMRKKALTIFYYLAESNKKVDARILLYYSDFFKIGSLKTIDYLLTIIYIQFLQYHNYIVSEKFEYHNILNNLEEIIDRKELKLKIINVLKLAVRNGYQISKLIIDKLANELINNPSAEVRAEAFSLLNEYSAESQYILIEAKARLIIEIEKTVQCIFDPKIEERNRENLKKKLLNTFLHQPPLTISLINNITNNIINNIQLAISKNILQAISDNELMISEAAFEIFDKALEKVAYRKNKYDEDFINIITKILCQHNKYSNNFAKTYFLLLKNNYINENILYYIVSAVKDGINIDDIVGNKLISLFSSQNMPIKKIALEILYYSNYSVSKDNFSYLAKEVFAVNDIYVKTLLILVLKRSDNYYSIDFVSKIITQFNDLLISENINIDENLINIINDIGWDVAEKNMDSGVYSKLIQRKIEYDFISDNDSNDKIFYLLKNINRVKLPFLEKTLIKALSVYDLINGKKKNLILKFWFFYISKEGNLPDVIVDFLVNLISEAKYNEIVLNILSKNSKYLPSQLEKLCAILLSTLSLKKQSVIINILCCNNIKSKLTTNNKKILHISKFTNGLLSENSETNKTIFLNCIEEIKNHLMKGYPVTALMIALIRRIYNKNKTIDIDLLRIATPKISIPLQEQYLWLLVKCLKINQDCFAEISQIIFQLLGNICINKNLSSALLSFLESNIINLIDKESKDHNLMLTLPYVKLLDKFANLLDCQLNSLFVCQLINKLMLIPFAYHKYFYDLLEIYVCRSDIVTTETLAIISKLIYLYDPTFPYFEIFNSTAINYSFKLSNQLKLLKYKYFNNIFTQSNINVEILFKLLFIIRLKFPNVFNSLSNLTYHLNLYTENNKGRLLNQPYNKLTDNNYDYILICLFINAYNINPSNICVNYDYIKKTLLANFVGNLTTHENINIVRVNKLLLHIENNFVNDKNTSNYLLFLVNIVNQAQKINGNSGCLIDNLTFLSSAKKVNWQSVRLHDENLVTTSMFNVINHLSSSGNNELNSQEIMDLIASFNLPIEKFVMFYNSCINITDKNKLIKFLLFIKDCTNKECGDSELFPIIDLNVCDIDAWHLKSYKKIIQRYLTLILDQVSVYFEKNSHKLNDINYLITYLLNSFADLFERGWSSSLLLGFLSKIVTLTKADSSYPLEQILYIFSLVQDYKINEEIFTIYYNKFIDLADPKEFYRELHHDTLSKSFVVNNTSMKLEDLLSLFNQMNDSNSDNLKNKKDNLLLKETIAEMISRINAITISNYYINQYIMTSDDSCQIRKLEISEWGIGELQDWSQRIKEVITHTPLVELMPEICAVLKRAVQIFSNNKFTLRDNQLMALIALIFVKDHGRFIQVETGEGKSLITACFAVIKALQGLPVDITTSSPLLANRDAEYFGQFYEYFNLKVASNNDRGYEKGVKKCYLKPVNIIYSDLYTLQFDYLRDACNSLGTRGERNFGVIVIDEVDNITLDEANKIAMLARSMPGMNQLSNLLIAIWSELKRVHANLFIENYCDHNGLTRSKLFYRDKQEDTNETLEIDDEFGFIAEHLTQFASQIIKNDGSQAFISFPKHLEKFVATQIQKWVRNAIAALYEYEENHHYRVNLNEDGEEVIEPVDFDNTGVTQVGTSWGDGLHQFLQIKHGLKLTSESLVTTFVSNMAYIKKYNNNIFGLSGTVGSTKEQQLLSKIYPIDFVKIPRHKRKQLVELPLKIEVDQRSRNSAVIAHALKEVQSGRNVLIVTETIKEAETIFSSLQSRHKGIVKKYIDSKEVKNDFLGTELDPGTIVVATNLAARGVDFQISQKSRSIGGLEVVCTFLAKNSRVEDQIWGRTCRKGEPGTVRYILSVESIRSKLLLDESISDETIAKMTIAEIRGKRDELEAYYLFKYENNELRQMQNKDLLFSQFMSFLKKHEKVLTIYERAAIEEKWAIWLKKHDFNCELGLCQTQLNLFLDKIQKRIEGKNIINNPYYWILSANDLLESFMRYKGKIKSLFTDSDMKKVLEMYDQAIKLDRNYAYIAYYNKGVILFKSQINDISLAEAKKIILTGKGIIEDYIFPKLEATKKLSHIYPNNNKGTYRKFLQEQIHVKEKFIQSLISSMNQILLSIDESRRLIDIRINDNSYIKRLNKEEAIKLLEKSEEKIFSLIFHGLKTDKNSFHQSQSIATLKKLQDGVRVNIHFQQLISLNSSEQFQLIINTLPINYFLNSDQKEPVINDLNTDAAVEVNKEKPFGRAYIAEISETADEPQRLVGFHDHINFYRDKLSLVAKNIKNKGNKTFGAVKQSLAPLSDVAKRIIYSKVLLESINVNVNFTQLLLDQALKILHAVENISYKTIIKSLDYDTLLIFSSSLPAELASYIFIKYINKNEKQLLLKSLSDFLCLPKEDIENFQIEVSNVNTQIVDSIFSIIKKTLEDSIFFHLNPSIVSLEISNLDQRQADKMIRLGFGSLNYSYVSMNKEQALALANYLCLEMNNAVIEVVNLTKDEALLAVYNASREIQPFSMTVQSIEAYLNKCGHSSHDILEYRNEGYLLFYDISEKGVIPWAEIGVVFTLGMLQILGGFALSASTLGFGASVGTSLMACGVSDFIRSIYAVYSRELNLSHYTLQKSMDLSLALLMAGWSTYRNAARALKAAQEAKTAITVADQTVSTLSSTTSLSGLQRATNQIIGLSIRTAVSESTSSSYNLIANIGCEQIQPILDDFIKQKVFSLCEESLWRSQFNYLFAMDQLLSRKVNWNRLKREATYIINSIEMSSLGISVLNSEIFDTFYVKMNKLLEDVENDQPSFQQMLIEKFPDLNKTEAQILYEILTKKEILYKDQIRLDALYEDQQKLDVLNYEKSSIKFKISYNKVDLGPQFNSLKVDIINFCQQCSYIFNTDFYTLRSDFRLLIVDLFKHQINNNIRSAVNLLKVGVMAGANKLGSKAASKVSNNFARRCEEKNASRLINKSDSSHHHAHGANNEIGNDNNDQDLADNKVKQPDINNSDGNDTLTNDERNDNDLPLDETTSLEDSKDDVEGLNSNEVEPEEKDNIKTGSPSPTAIVNKGTQTIPLKNNIVVKNRAISKSKPFNKILNKNNKHCKSYRLGADDKYNLNIQIANSLSLLQAQAIKSYESTLQEYLCKERLFCDQIRDKCDEDKLKLFDRFITKKSQLIKCILGIALIQLKFEKQISIFYEGLHALSESHNQKISIEKEVSDEINELFSLCTDNLDDAYNKAIFYFQSIYGDFSSITDILSLLKSKFDDYFQFNQEINNMLTNDTGNITTNAGTSNAQLDNNRISKFDANNAVNQGSQMIVAISGAIGKYQETRKAVIQAKAETAKEIMGTINQLAQQVQNLVQSQNDVIKTSTANFIKLCEKIDNVTPEKIENLRKERLQKLEEQAEKLLLMYESSFEKGAPNDRLLEMYDTRRKELEKAAEQADIHFTNICEGLRKSIKESQQSYCQLMVTLKVSDNQVIMQAMELQQKMVSFAERLLDLKPKKEDVPLDYPSKSKILSVKEVLEIDKEGDNAYSNGKSAFKINDTAGASKFFADAKKYYQQLPSKDLSNEIKTKIDKRIAKIDIKYAPPKLTM